MHHILTLASLLAAVSTVQSDSCPTGRKIFDPATCTSKGNQCKWTMDTGSPFAMYCSCNDSTSTNPADLVWFYTGTKYTWLEYRGFAAYGECKNLPDFFDKNVASMQTNTKPSTVCCVYTEKDCKAGESKQMDEGNVEDLGKILKNDVRSFRCSRWVDDNSKCTDGSLKPATKRFIA